MKLFENFPQESKPVNHGDENLDMTSLDFTSPKSDEETDLDFTGEKNSTREKQSEDEEEFA